MTSCKERDEQADEELLDALKSMNIPTNIDLPSNCQVKIISTK